MKIRVTTDKHEYQGLFKGSEHDPVGWKDDGSVITSVVFSNLGKFWTLKREDFELVEDKVQECRSPYCECEKDKCSGGRVDKRGEPMESKQKTACDFLSTALSLLEERGKDYDQPQGERSMGRTVAAFNSITNKELTEAEGWLLLQILKDVRQWQNPDKYHADSAEDCVSYAALKAEALFSAESKEKK